MQKIKALYTPNHTLACSYLKQAWTTQAQTKNDRIVLIKQTRAKLAKHLKTRRHKCYKLACATGKQAGIQEVIKQYQECEAKQKILLEELTQNITSQIIKLTKAVILDELSSNPKIIAKRVSAAISQCSFC